jgi:hypothetical protein
LHWWNLIYPEQCRTMKKIVTLVVVLWCVLALPAPAPGQC